MPSSGGHPQTTILKYDVNPHAYGRPDHATDEAEVRAAVKAAFEWWYNPTISMRVRQQLYAGIAGPVSGPVMVIKYNATRNVVNTAYYEPTLDEAHRVIWEQGYTMPVAIAPIF